jgi:seryl-tRNA synthetase
VNQVFRGRQDHMIQQTIEKIEERLQKTISLNEGNKSELLKLISTLKVEIDDLSKTHNEQAESITRFAALSTHEATRQEKDLKLLNLSIEGLNTSVQGFEASHPRLVNAVNDLCSMLSNLGI